MEGKDRDQRRLLHEIFADFASWDKSRPSELKPIFEKCLKVVPSEKVADNLGIDTERWEELFADVAILVKEEEYRQIFKNLRQICEEISGKEVKDEHVSCILLFDYDVICPTDYELNNNIAYADYDYLDTVHDEVEEIRAIIRKDNPLLSETVSKNYDLLRLYPKHKANHVATVDLFDQLSMILNYILKNNYELPFRTRTQEWPYLEVFIAYCPADRFVFKGSERGIVKDWSFHDLVRMDEVNTLPYFFYLRSVISYSFISFLAEENRKKLRICDQCNNYHIRKNPRETPSGLFFCCKPCRMKYHHSKPEYREKKAAAQREKYGWAKRVNAK